MTEHYLYTEYKDETTHFYSNTEAITNVIDNTKNKMLIKFEEYIRRIDGYLKLIGMSTTIKYIDQSIFTLLRKYWNFCFQQFFYHLCTLQQIIWLIMLILSGGNLLQITYLIPCVTFCMLGGFRIGYFFYNIYHVNDVIEFISKLSAKISNDENIMKNKFKRLTNVSKLLLYLAIFAVVAFAIGPVLMIAGYYYTYGIFKLFLPFVIWYPFDPYDIRFWPFVYFHEMWAAFVAVLSVYGPDCFFFTCCTFIHIHFIYLHQDIETVLKKESLLQNDEQNRNDAFKRNIVQLVNRHRELIRCVALLEIIYSKSTLFNVLTGSIIICVTGFNLMAFKNYVLMTPFCSFLIFGLLQVYFYCYYSDNVMTSSMAVGNAIYNSQWYGVGVKERKYILIIMIRSQKPCKFTAYGFTDINMKAFTRILSTSWSYFALLNQMYRD